MICVKRKLNRSIVFIDFYHYRMMIGDFCGLQVAITDNYKNIPNLSHPGSRAIERYLTGSLGGFNSISY